MDLGVRGSINGTVDYGAVVMGTIVPPNITAFSLYVLGANLGVDVELSYSVSGAQLCLFDKMARLCLETLVGVLFQTLGRPLS